MLVVKTGGVAQRQKSARKQGWEEAGHGRRRLAATAMVLCVLALAACSRAAPPAPVDFKGSASAGAPASAAPVDARASSPRSSAPSRETAPAPAPQKRESVTIGKLEDDGGSRSYSTTPAAPGERRSDFRHNDAPPKRTEIAGPSDTVYTVARRNDLAPRDLIDANRLEAPYRLNDGQRLLVPEARVHVVAPGETIYAISRTYNVDVFSLVQANRIQQPYTILVGQRLTIPGASQAAAPAATETAHNSAANLPAAAPQPVAVASPLPPRTSGRFLWPVRGRVVSEYGSKPDGLHNDGINIAVKQGEAVRAADNGVVAYAGNELRGFGNLLLVRHSDGWVTAYAHNDKMLVNRGDVVKRGQTIAQAGASGRVGGPQLHFEIRQGTKAVDPLRYLEPL